MQIRENIHIFKFDSSVKKKNEQRGKKACRQDSAQSGELGAPVSHLVESFFFLF